MSNERKPWERMESEPLKWFSRFERFRRMKPWKRSVNAVFEEEIKEKQGNTRTKISKSWYKKADEWQWNSRADAWDKHRTEEQDRLIALEEAEILKSAYALKSNRIKDLNALAELLNEEVFDEGKRWIEDVKAVGKSPYYVKQFSDSLVREYRATLDDIAKEKGERVKLTKSELTGKDDGPLDIEVTTQWGRNTDPRRKPTQSEESPAITETDEESGDSEDLDENAAFGIEVPGEDDA